jgi:exopolysaccharide biosynthesis polyprenyl glycosylphosphotransferase
MRTAQEQAAAVGVGRRAEAAVSERTPFVHRRGWLVRRALLAADLVGLMVAFLVAELALPGAAHDRIEPAVEIGLFVLALPFFVVMAKLQGLYDHDEERTDQTTADDLVGIFYLVTTGTWLFFATLYVFNLASPSVERLTLFWAVSIALVALSRATARVLCRRSVSYLQNTIIVGVGEVGQRIGRKLMVHREYGLKLVGFVDEEPSEKPKPPEHEQPTLLGGLDQLPAFVHALDVERVIVAFSCGRDENVLPLIRELGDNNVQVDIVPRFHDVVGRGVDLHDVEGLTLVGLRPFHLSRSSRLLKRAMDATIAALLLILLAPLFAIVAVAIKLDSRGPVFFRQVRVGVRGQPFRIWKFRSMKADAEAHKAEVAGLNMHRNGDGPQMFKVPDDPRMTRVGGFLRRWSLDELPQLFNVLAGRMSLVGPRPLILDEDDQVHDWARKRLDLKPGITGLWQAKGRSEIPFDEMVRLDYLYVTSWSPMTDIKLAFQTIPALFRERQAY